MHTDSLSWNTYSSTDRTRWRRQTGAKHTRTGDANVSVSMSSDPAAYTCRQRHRHGRTEGCRSHMRQHGQVGARTVTTNLASTGECSTLRLGFTGRFNHRHAHEPEEPLAVLLVVLRHRYRSLAEPVLVLNIAWYSAASTQEGGRKEDEMGRLRGVGGSEAMEATTQTHTHRPPSPPPSPPQPSLLQPFASPAGQ